MEVVFSREMTYGVPFLLFLAFWLVGGRGFAREDQYCGGVEVVNSVVGL